MPTNNYYANLDMNGNAIYHVPDATDNQQPATYGQLMALQNSMIKKVFTTIGDGSSTNFSIAHNLGTQDILVQVRETASPYSFIAPSSIKATGINTVAISFVSAPTVNQYKVIILG